MARIVDAKFSTLIGTPKQVQELLRLLGSGAAVVDLKNSKVLLLSEPATEARVREALATDASRGKGSATPDGTGSPSGATRTRKPRSKKP